jgi:hypothetical protein
VADITAWSRDRLRIVSYHFICCDPATELRPFPSTIYNINAFTAMLIFFNVTYMLAFFYLYLLTGKN